MSLSLTLTMAAQDGTMADAAPDGDESSLWVPLNESKSSDVRTRDQSNVWTSGSLRSAVVVPSSSGVAAVSDVEPTDASRASLGNDMSETMTASYRSIVSRSHSSRGDRNNSNAESLRAMQQRLETRQALKEGLVDRPLNQFAGKFIVHLLRELWNQDYYLRCGTF